MSELTDICSRIQSRFPRVAELQKALTAIPALGPENGGQGELAKAAFVEKCLEQAGVTDILHADSPDPRVESGSRPNLVARIPGRSQRTLWLFGHLDVVPAGNLQAWQTDPWQACEKDGMIYGRGVEDNQQAICSMLVLAESLACLQPELTLGLVFMADEETGSSHGLGWILQKRPELFARDDLYIVPDGGSPDASLIEIAEKAQLWLRFRVRGRQCHASMPDEGINSLVAASRLVLELDQLNHIFEARNPLFVPDHSTFTPTMHERNVDAVNILPGEDVFYLDCRLLPELPIAEALAACQRILASQPEAIKTEYEIIHRREATAISPDAPVVRELERAIMAVYRVQPSPCGIGGATVAAFLRDAGLPAAVWACLENTCHQPSERSSIKATLRDAEVFAHILMRRPGA